MSTLPRTLEKIIDSLSRLPGIGKKTAQRLGMYIIKLDDDLYTVFYFSNIRSIYNIVQTTILTVLSK